MSEHPQPDPQPADVMGLLFKAVKGLPEAEQRAIFAHFLERAIGSGGGQASLLGPLAAATALMTSQPGLEVKQQAALAALASAQRPPGGDQVTIPVRISEAQHKRLKQWCAEHGFPMAVVVRGLVERFLDGWDKRAA